MKKLNKFLGKFLTVSAMGIMLSTTAMAAGEDGNLTLADAMTKGILTNPEYGVVANDSLATREELSQAKGGYLPSVDFLGETGFEHTDTPTIENEDLWKTRGSLTLTQMLFDGWGVKSEVMRQKARVESTAGRVGEVAEFVGLDIVEAYLEVLRQRDLLAIARANVDDHLRILGTIRTGASAGTVTEGDVAQANARLAQARATTSSVQEALRNAESLFIQKVGEMPGDMAFPEVPRESLPATVEDAVRDAMTNSPTLRILEADIDVSKAEFKAAHSSMYPQVDLEINGTLGSDVEGIEGTEERASALAVMRWNLYRGGADQARQREFMYRHAISKERRAQAARQVEKEMRDSWAGMIASNERAKQFLDQANANEQVVNVYMDQFTLDRRTLLDVLDAQNELFVSRSSHVNALYTEIFGVYRVLALKGDLLRTMGVALPREAHADMPAHQPVNATTSN